jgi:hypothetical protein
MDCTDLAALAVVGDGGKAVTLTPRWALCSPCQRLPRRGTNQLTSDYCFGVDSHLSNSSSLSHSRSLSLSGSGTHPHFLVFSPPSASSPHSASIKGPWQMPWRRSHSTLSPTMYVYARSTSICHGICFATVQYSTVFLPFDRPTHPPTNFPVDPSRSSPGCHQASTPLQ